MPIECAQGATAVSPGVIYDLLSELAKRERSIQPIVLEKDKYRLLLSCPQVRMCSAAEDVSALAKAANYVLLAATGELVPSDRLIAEVTLCIREFMGRSLEQRIEETRGHLTIDRYKKNRKRVLSEIVQLLLRDTPRHNTIALQLPGSARPDGRRVTAEGVAETSADLHYAALLPLFSTYLYHALPDDAHIISERSWDGFMAGSFDAFCRFLHSSAVATFVKELSPATVRSIDELTDYAVHVAPFQYEAGENQYPLGLLSFYGTQITNSGRFARYTHLNILYEKGWRLWLEAQLFGLNVMDEFSQAPTPGVMPRLVRTPKTIVPFEALKGSPLAALAIIGYKAERLVATEVSYKYPVVAKAHARAHRALSYYYDIDTGQLLSNGLSLREVADRFFEQEPARLDTLNISVV